MSRRGMLAAVIAHRGASGDAPENTLAALSLAADQGALCVEFDVAISADDIPFLHHDDTLERCTDGTGRLCDLAAARVDTLNAAAGFPWPAREPVPRLVAAIALIEKRGLAANLEIKPPAGLEARTARAICKVVETAWPASRNLVISSFSPIALAEAHRCLPGVPRALIADRVPHDIVARAAGLALSNLHCDAAHLEPAELECLRRIGLGVYTYTVNDPKRAFELLAQGVDGLFTDYPERMLRAMAPSLPDG